MRPSPPKAPLRSRSDRAEAAKVLAEAVDRLSLDLSDEDARVWDLHVSGYSYREIAQATGTWYQDVRATCERIRQLATEARAAPVDESRTVELARLDSYQVEVDKVLRWKPGDAARPMPPTTTERLRAVREGRALVVERVRLLGLRTPEEVEITHRVSGTLTHVHVAADLAETLARLPEAAFQALLVAERAFAELEAASVESPTTDTN